MPKIKWIRLRSPAGGKKSHFRPNKDLSPLRNGSQRWTLTHSVSFVPHCTPLNVRMRAPRAEGRAHGQRSEGGDTRTSSNLKFAYIRFSHFFLKIKNIPTEQPILTLGRCTSSPVHVSIPALVLGFVYIRFSLFSLFISIKNGTIKEPISTLRSLDLILSPCEQSFIDFRVCLHKVLTYLTFFK